MDTPASLDPVAFFDAAWDAYPSEPDTLDLAVGGGRIRIHLASPAMRTFVGVMDHVTVPAAGVPDLVIACGDGSSVSLPPRPWSDGDHRERGEIRGMRSGRILGALLPDARALSLFDAARGRAMFWAPDASRLPSSERAAPFRVILSWWARSRGLVLLHAAAVGMDGRGVLLAGPGGSGKSTCALAALASGLSFLSDDYTLVEPEDLSALGLFASAKVGGWSASRFTKFAAHRLARTPGEEKTAYDLTRIARDRLARRLDLCGILLPRVRGDCTALYRARFSDAVRALAPSTIFQLPGGGEATLSTVAALVRELPCWRLDLGPDIEAVPRLIRDMLTTPVDA